jgi:hypothetical protein
MNNIKPRVLFVAGLFVMAIHSLLRTLIDRAHHTTDSTDFALGILMGIGIGLVCLAIWRMRRPRHFV